MSKFFSKCTTLDELKKEYKAAAMKHHPDLGGDEDIMKAINAEYDELFPIFKLRFNQSAEAPTHETAESTRSEFYTENGWKGENYDSHLTTTEISQKIREYVKKAYPDCKFSVTTHYASMCSNITVILMSGPYEAVKDGSGQHSVNQFYVQNDTQLTEWAKAVMIDVNDLIRSYNYDDSDCRFDYFDTNFYYSLGVGKWNKPYTVCQKTKKVAAKKTAASEAGAVVATAEEGIRVEINEEFSGIEVYFAAKPTAEVRTKLKANGWRWHGKKHCWYNRNTEENLRSLRAITA